MTALKRCLILIVRLLDAENLSEQGSETLRNPEGRRRRNIGYNDESRGQRSNSEANQAGVRSRQTGRSIGTHGWYSRLCASRGAAIALQGIEDRPSSIICLK